MAVEADQDASSAHRQPAPPRTAEDTRAEGTSAPSGGIGPLPTSGVTPEVPQPEDSGTCPATPSEVETAMSHRHRKASLRSAAFTSQEFNALSSVDAYLSATRSVFEKAVGVLSQGLQGAREKSDHLVEILSRTEGRLNNALAEVEQVKTFTREAHAEALGHLERDLWPEEEHVPEDMEGVGMS